MNKPSGRGRRAGSPDTREQILDAARSRFLTDGYQATTMRAIATDAGVDVALVSYYFGGKQGLFGAALSLPVNPIEVVAPIIEGASLAELPGTLLRTLVTAWDDPATGPPLREMAIAATNSPELSRVVSEAVTRELIERMAERLGPGETNRQRAGAFSTQMAGLIFARYIIRLEPIASMSIDDVVERMSPALAATLGSTPTQ